MKTKITQNIDGYKIITGIGDAHIDAVATTPLAIEKLKTTEEYQAFESKKGEIIPIIKQAKTCYRNAKNALDLKNKLETDKSKMSPENYQSLKNQYNLEYEKYSLEWQTLNLQIKQIESELSGLSKPLLEKQKSLIISEAVYLQPAPGEEIITDEEAEKISTAYAEAFDAGKLIDVDLKQIADYRGKVVYDMVSGMAKRRVIEKLGDKPGNTEILESDLTDAERADIFWINERFRISALSKSEKTAEKTKILAGLATAAAAKKVELEIQGDNNAMKTTKSWYEAEALKIEELYA
jgi:hypothetical protein